MELILPEYAKYVYEINYLRLKVSRAIAHRDALKYHICKYIELDYMLKIGALNYKQKIIENKVNKAKRMLYYLKDIKVKPQELPALIKKDFAEADKEVEIMQKEVNAAIDMSLKRIPTEEEILELNSYYLMLVKDYCPEINIKSTDEEKTIFEEITKVFKNGNIKSMKKYEQTKKDELYFDELEAYKVEKIRLQGVLEKTDKEIAEIKNSFPYTEKLSIQDENLFRRRKEGINIKIQELELELETLQKELKNF